MTEKATFAGGCFWGAEVDHDPTRAQPRFPRPIATEITTATTFWPAEEYHQQYPVKNGRATCRI